MSSATLFDVQLRLEAEEPREDARELVTNALAEAGSMGSVKGSMAVSATDRGVTVRFEDVAAPGDTEGAGQVQDVLPVVQALINAIAERVAAEPPTNPRLVIEVRPAEPHKQHELRHS